MVLLAAGILTALGLGVPAAQGDFHPVCTGMITAYANVDLRSGDDGLEYSGLVHCPDATVTIDHLGLYAVPSEGEPVLLSNTTGEACAAGLASPCALSAQSPAEPATLMVRMNFTADDPSTDGPDFTEVPRHGLWVWTGMGEPVPICRSAGVFPVMVGMC